MRHTSRKLLHTHYRALPHPLAGDGERLERRSTHQDIRMRKVGRGESTDISFHGCQPCGPANGASIVIPLDTNRRNTQATRG